VPLQSKIFRGDRALDACLVDDKAHIVEGSRGPHVRKLQQALAVLDGALIGLDEVSSELYGPNTAAAVLSYKRARKIINFSYQTTADNIVGKMTIATLDREMLKGEARPPLRGCLDETRPSGTRGGAAIAAANASGFAEGAPGNAPATVLRIAFQDALGENEIGIATPTRMLLLSAKALKLFRPFNFQLQTEFLGSFPFPKAIAERDEIDVGGLRKAAQKANPGSDSSLRVIFCKFLPTTSTGTSNGAVTGIEGFKNFVLVNKEKVHPDLGTLAHEMIHCSDDFLMSDLLHEKDLNNIFSFGPNRTIVSSEHVTSLRKCFFR
jgi:peptidoglycan hydrolase-like protein with peptidoglycan-binding domain